MITTKAQAIAIINDHLGVNIGDFKRESRLMYSYNKTTKLPMLVTAVRKDSLVGLLSDTYDSFAVIGDRVVLYNKFRDSGLTYARESAFYTIDGKVYVNTYMDYLYGMFTANGDAIAKTAEYKAVLERTGAVSRPTVFMEMATDRSVFYEDPEEFKSSLVEAVISANAVPSTNEIEISADVRYGGKLIQPHRMRWELWPEQTIPGIPVNKDNIRATSEQIPGVFNFRVATDLRNRKAYILMSPKQVSVNCFIWLKESDDDTAYFQVNKVIDLSPIIPAYDYFG